MFLVDFEETSHRRVFMQFLRFSSQCREMPEVFLESVGLSVMISWDG